jgi:Zn-dependent peptidase ImmA (M78 family)
MTSVRVDVQPSLLQWARERARMPLESLTKVFPKLPEWESQTAKPTLKQLENYARRTHAPVGYFFLTEPPDEPVPIPDFRTVGDRPVGRPSANLLDMLYICQERQDWFRTWARTEGLAPLDFPGSVLVGTNVDQAAEEMRTALGFDVEARAGFSFDQSFREFRRNAEESGVLVMTSGIAGNSTARRLDPDEFRGFALVDDYAPLVFVNTADSTSAQIFTLAHELVHIWTGRSGITGDGIVPAKRSEEERWCNRVAAQLLVPLELLRDSYHQRSDLTSELQRLARQFKVSTLVILRRVFDAGHLTESAFWSAYRAELARVSSLERAEPASKGGDFYNSALARVNRRLAEAVVASTLEGHTTYREAFRLLAVKNVRTLREIGRHLGMAV